MTKQYIRPSQIITTFGPGSIVDLPEDSVMIAGIEHWFSEGHKPHKKISDPRLQTALKVGEFRTPPVGTFNGNDVPFVRFPRWRVCPKCFLLSNLFPENKGAPELAPKCPSCNVATHPARIVVACAKGHIEDFPWYWWCHRNKKCAGGHLFLKGEGKSAALSDLKVECSCGIEPRSLSGALGKDAIPWPCRGRRPWLDDNNEHCSERLYSLQRGASNVYFSVVRSAVSIPPWSDPLQVEVASWWGAFQNPLPTDVWPVVIKARFPNEKEERIRQYINRVEELKNSKPSIRHEEYQALDTDQDYNSIYFEARNQKMLLGTKNFLSRLVAIPRLREVRALLGFTRIQAPELDPTMELFDEEREVPVAPAPISASHLNWLPAIENLGEGVFLSLNPKRLQEWENLTAVKERADTLLNTYSIWRQKLGLEPLKGQGPRLILLHTLAHLFMRQMSLDCGYSSASLRERIYSGINMLGLLIYTSTPDSDGSLGGLVRQTKPPTKFEALLRSCLDIAKVCSNDPLCREHNHKHTEQQRLNMAACHACAMVSETSCEFGNRLLDRGLVVNLPNESPTGYFNYDG